MLVLIYLKEEICSKYALRKINQSRPNLSADACNFERPAVIVK
jgi:hypothetical protein